MARGGRHDCIPAHASRADTTSSATKRTRLPTANGARSHATIASSYRECWMSIKAIVSQSTRTLSFRVSRGELDDPLLLAADDPLGMPPAAFDVPALGDERVPARTGRHPLSCSCGPMPPATCGQARSNAAPPPSAKERWSYASSTNASRAYPHNPTPPDARTPQSGVLCARRASGSGARKTKDGVRCW
jgi:hypothetical protein